MKKVTDNPSETVVRAWARLLRAQRVALGQVESALKQAGLPALGWYDVLLELERAAPNGLRPFELEKKLLLEQYNLSRLLERIEQAGYLERRRTEEDGRGYRLFLTAAGKATRKRMWPVYASGIDAALGARLTAKQAQQLDELLGVLLEMVGSTAV